MWPSTSSWTRQGHTRQASSEGSQLGDHVVPSRRPSSSLFTSKEKRVWGEEERTAEEERRVGARNCVSLVCFPIQATGPITGKKVPVR